MWQWANSNAGALGAVAAFGTLILIVALAGVVGHRYLTKKSPPLARQGLGPNAQPQLTMHLEYRPRFIATLTVENKSSCSAVVTGILIKTKSGEKLNYAVHYPVSAHSKNKVDIAAFLVDATSAEHPTLEIKTNILLGVEYTAMREHGMAGYLEYAVRVSQSRVVEIVAISDSATELARIVG